MKLTSNGLPVGGVALAGVYVNNVKIKDGGTATTDGERVYYQSVNAQVRSCLLDGSDDQLVLNQGATLIVAGGGCWAVWLVDVAGSNVVTSWAFQKTLSDITAVNAMADPGLQLNPAQLHDLAVKQAPRITNAAVMAITDAGDLLVLSSYNTGSGLAMYRKGQNTPLWILPSANPIIRYPYPQAFAVSANEVVWANADGQLFGYGMAPTQVMPAFDPFVIYDILTDLYWVGYHTNDGRLLLHPIEDASRGYVLATGLTYGSTSTRAYVGYSRNAGESQMESLKVDWSQPMVPLAPIIDPPVPVKPIGPTSQPAKDGTSVDLTPYFSFNPPFWPRGVVAQGDTHGMDYQPVLNGFCFVKFGDVGKGKLYELMAVKEGYVHLIEDASNATLLDTWPADTRLCPTSMKVGYQYRFTTSACELVQKTRGTCAVVNRIPWITTVWIDKFWPSYWCSESQGEQPVVRLVIDNTGGFHGPDRMIETRLLSLKGSWSQWDSYASDQVYASGVPVIPDVAKMSSAFWRVGGPRYAPVLSGCAPAPAFPVEPPVPTPIPPTPSPVNGVMPLGFILWSNQPFLSQDKRFTLLYQSDGNLVLYGPRGPMWATGTNGKSVGFVALQGDGNWVVYGANSKPQWASGTNGKPVKELIVQNDGNIVMYSTVGPVWATGTVYQPVPPNPIPPMPIPPGPGNADMHAWPKHGASYTAGMTNPACDPVLWASLNRDSGGNFTRMGCIDAWAVGPNGTGQYNGFMPWTRDAAGVFDLAVPDPRYDERLNAYVRAQNQAGATVQISIFDLYSWSERKQGLLWVPDQNLGPFRRNRNGVRWGNPDDPTFLSLPDWVMGQLIARVCVAVKGLAVCFETGNEMPEKDMHARIAAELRSHFTADWKPDITVNRQEDTPGQYFNMKIGTNYDRISYHGKDRISYLDDVDTDEPPSRPNTFRKLFEQSWDEGRVDPKRVIMSSDGCRASSSDVMNTYDWPVLAEVFKDHIRRGFSTEHQSRVKMRMFLNNRLDLTGDFETDWLLSLR